MEASLPLGSKSPLTACPLAEATYLPLLAFEGCPAPLPTCLFPSGPEKTGFWLAHLSLTQALKRVQDGARGPGLKTWRGPYLTL